MFTNFRPLTFLCFLASLFAALSMGERSACAQQTIVHAVLQCDGDDFIVRFGETQNYRFPVSLYELPESLRARWEGIDAAPENRCTLASGEPVMVRYARGQSRATGMGGGDPSSFVSVWVNRKKIVSRESIDATGSVGGFKNSVAYAGQELTRCHYPPPGWPAPSYDEINATAITCQTETLDLAAIAPDPFELPENDRDPIGTVSVLSPYNPEFCRQFVVRDPNLPRDFSIGSRATNARDGLSVSILDAEVPFEHNFSGVYKSAPFDFNNDGVADTLINVSGFLDRESNTIVVTTGEASDEAVAEAARKVRAWENFDYFATPRWETYSTAQTPYQNEVVRLVPFRMGNLTYIMVVPVHRERARPSAVLMRVNFQPTAPMEGTLETVCTFQVIEENF